MKPWAGIQSIMENVEFLALELKPRVSRELLIFIQVFAIYELEEKFHAGFVAIELCKSC